MADFIEHEPCYIYYVRKYQENSQIIEAITPNYGSVSFITKGGPSFQAQTNGIFQPFVPLRLTLQKSKGELYFLREFECCGQGYKYPLPDFYSAMYVNELLHHLYRSKEGDVKLFGCYIGTLESIANKNHINLNLRLFEINLLNSLGYALTSRDDEGSFLKPQSWYRFCFGAGFVEVDPDLMVGLDEANMKSAALNRKPDAPVQIGPQDALELQEDPDEGMMFPKSKVRGPRFGDNRPVNPWPNTQMADNFMIQARNRGLGTEQFWQKYPDIKNDFIGPTLRGADLLDIVLANFSLPDSAKNAKLLLGSILDRLLNGKEIVSRRMYREYAQLHNQKFKAAQAAKSAQAMPPQGQPAQVPQSQVTTDTQNQNNAPAQMQGQQEFPNGNAEQALPPNMQEQQAYPPVQTTQPQINAEPSNMQAAPQMPAAAYQDSPVAAPDMGASTPAESAVPAHAMPQEIAKEVEHVPSEANVPSDTSAQATLEAQALVAANEIVAPQAASNEVHEEVGAQVNNEVGEDLGKSATNKAFDDLFNDLSTQADDGLPKLDERSELAENQGSVYVSQFAKVHEQKPSSDKEAPDFSVSYLGDDYESESLTLTDSRGPISAAADADLHFQEPVDKTTEGAAAIVVGAEEPKGKKDLASHQVASIELAAQDEFLQLQAAHVEQAKVDQKALDEAGADKQNDAQGDVKDKPSKDNAKEFNAEKVVLEGSQVDEPKLASLDLQDDKKEDGASQGSVELEASNKLSVSTSELDDGPSDEEAKAESEACSEAEVKVEAEIEAKEEDKAETKVEPEHELPPKDEPAPKKAKAAKKSSANKAKEQEQAADAAAKQKAKEELAKLKALKKEQFKKERAELKAKEREQAREKAAALKAKEKERKALEKAKEKAAAQKAREKEREAKKKALEKERAKEKAAAQRAKEKELKAQQKAKEKADAEAKEALIDEIFGNSLLACLDSDMKKRRRNHGK